MVANKNGRDTARSTSWATPSAYKKQNDGEPGQTTGQSSRHYEGHRPDSLQGSRWGGRGRENTSNVPDCVRFVTWNGMVYYGLTSHSTCIGDRLMYAMYSIHGQNQVLE